MLNCDIEKIKHLSPNNQQLEHQPLQVINKGDIKQRSSGRNIMSLAINFSSLLKTSRSTFEGQNYSVCSIHPFWGYNIIKDKLNAN